MNEEEIKELFNKYGVKDLKEKNGQSECYCCKNIKHKYSLTWTSFLYEYKEHYYCYDCLLSILLQQENAKLKEELEKQFKSMSAIIQHNYDLYLEESNKLIKERQHFKQELTDYKERNEKAIEVAKENWGKCMYCETIAEILDKKDKE